MMIFCIFKDGTADFAVSRSTAGQNCSYHQQSLHSCRTGSTACPSKLWGPPPGRKLVPLHTALRTLHSLHLWTGFLLLHPELICYLHRHLQRGVSEQLPRQYALSTVTRNRREDLTRSLHHQQGSSGSRLSSHWTLPGVLSGLGAVAVKSQISGFQSPFKKCHCPFSLNCCFLFLSSQSGSKSESTCQMYS